MAGGSLDPLFNPTSIAVLGASADLGRISGKPLRFLREFGYRGRIYPINPKYSELHGWRCYASVEDLPEPPDLVIIAVPTRLVVTSLEQCARAGARSILIFTSGFAETGEAGRDLQRRVALLARTSGMRICGPNCIGLHNLHQGAAATFTSALDGRPVKPGPVGFVSQSGALGAYVFAGSQEAGIGFSTWLNTGNEVDVELSECLEYFASDPATTIITAWAEGLRDGPGLRRAGELARRADKPLILLKAGRSQDGRRAAASHTASLASNDRVVDGACRQHGIVRVADLQELQDATLACLSARLPTGRGVGIIGMSGGAGVLMADECSRLGLRVPELAPEQVSRLRDLLPWFASPQNPVDTTAQLINDPAIFKACLATLAEDPEIHTLILFLGMQPALAERIARDTVEVARATTKPIFVTWMLTPPAARRILEEAQIPLYEDPVRCLSGLAALIRSVEARRLPERESSSPTRDLPAEALQLRGEVQVANGEVRWSEPRTKRLLRAYGIGVTREHLVESADAARRAAAILGWPVVVKLAAGRLIHKTAVGGVRVGLQSPEQVAQATDELLALGNQHPDWEVEGVLVQEQIQDTFELLVGVSHDAAFGSTVSLGCGGSLAELIDDVAVRLPPLQLGDTAVMLAELRSGPAILRRGLDLAAVDESLLKLSHFAEDLADLEIELDINPLFVHRLGGGAVAGDAALIARPRSIEASSWIEHQHSANSQ